MDYSRYRTSTRARRPASQSARPPVTALAPVYQAPVAKPVEPTQPLASNHKQHIPARPVVAPQLAPVQPLIPSPQPATDSLRTAPTVSIRISVPQFNNQALKALLSWRPTIKQLLFLLSILLLMTVSYQMGRHHELAKVSAPATLMNLTAEVL